MTVNGNWGLPFKQHWPADIKELTTKQQSRINALGSESSNWVALYMRHNDDIVCIYIYIYIYVVSTY